MSALRELRRLLRRQSEADTGSGGEACDEETGGPGKACLPLLQVWPSQDSPRGEADGQSFVFPPDDIIALTQVDSGIDSQQVLLVSLFNAGIKTLYNNGLHIFTCSPVFKQYCVAYIVLWMNGNVSYLQIRVVERAT